MKPIKNQLPSAISNDVLFEKKQQQQINVKLIQRLN
jgi:hypothetical protein